MQLRLCFSHRFCRLCNELKIPELFLKKQLEKSLKNIKKRIKAKRLFFDTHGNLLCSSYVCMQNDGLIRIQTYSIDDKCLSKKQKNFLLDVWHELRHFQQDKIYGMNMDEYSMKDMSEANSKYFNSQIEKDARKYEKKSLKIYKSLKKLTINQIKNSRNAKKIKTNIKTSNS